MKKRKILLACLIGVALIVTLGSAGVASELSPEVKSWVDMVRQKYAGTTLAVSFATHPSTDAFIAMAPEFERLTGIRIIWDVVQSSELRPKHFLEFSAGTARYDVLMSDGFWIAEYATRKIVRPLEPFLKDPALTPSWFDYEDILPAYREGLGTVSGTIYGIPTAGESRFIAYRKDLFEKYGKKPPETMDELLECARFFNGREPELYGIGMRAQRGIHFSSGWLTVMYQFGGGFFDQETWEVSVNSPETVDSLTYFVELLKQGPPDTASFTHEEATSSFMSGKTAMWWDATAIAPWIEDPTKSLVAGKVGYLPPPEGPSGRFGALAGWNAAISAQSSKPEAAWAFIVWMTSRLNSKKYLDSGGVLCRTSNLEDPEILATNPQYYEALIETFDAAGALVDRGLRWIPPIFIAAPILERAGFYGNRALIGELSPKEACELAADELQQIMEDIKAKETAGSK